MPKLLNWIERFIAYILILSLLHSLLSSCAAKRYPATTAIGYVISVDGDQVLVSFEVVQDPPGSQAAHWFYVPAHSYKKGDRYPDPSKDPNLLPDGNNR